ncbi:MAG: hypothetical protein JWR80_8906 [Bradyrhizobium sp.]|nr:hypothetical protein [Bradyrhizobium sp.]
MDPATGKAIFGIAKRAIGAVAKPIALERARRESQRLGLLDPSPIRPIIDEAIQLLAQDAATLAGSLKDWAKAIASERPAMFKHGAPSEWISTKQAQHSVAELSTALIGKEDAQPSPDELAFYASFVTDDTDPDVGEVFDTAITFIIASVNRHLDQPTRVALARLEPQLDRIESRVIAATLPSAFATSGIARDALDQALDREVWKLRHAMDVTEDARGRIAVDLADRVLTGDLAGACAERKAFALAWAARLAANYAQETKVQSIVQAAAGLDRSVHVRAAEAMLAGRSDWTVGLSLLQPLDHPVLRATALRLRIRAASPTEALSWFAATGWGDADLDPTGRLSLMDLRAKSEQWTDLHAGALALDDAVYAEEPALLQLAATGLAAMAMPEDTRALLFAGVPFEQVAIPLADDPSSLADRRRAADLFDRAMLSSRQRGGIEASRLWRTMALWLRLRDLDPATAASARCELAAGIDLADDALSLVPLALQFGTPVDATAVERAIARADALNPAGSFEAARAKLAMIVEQKEPADVAKDLARFHASLSRQLDPAALMFMRAAALHHAGEDNEARQLTEEARRQSMWSPQMERLEQSMTRSLSLGDVADGFDLDMAPTPALSIEVGRLARLGADDRFVDAGRALLRRTRSIRDAEQIIGTLVEHGRHADARSILDVEAGALVASSPRLLSMRAWDSYRLGRLADAESDLAQVLAMRDHPADRALRVNLLIVSGRWQDLGAFVEGEWSRLAERNPEEILGLARLATAIRSPRRDALVDLAATAGADDPDILIACYLAAVQAGREKETEPSAWLARAADLSGADGPVQRANLRDMIDAAPEWRRQLDEVAVKLRRGELPLFMASEVRRSTLLETQLLTMIANRRAQPRERTLIPLFSGARAGMAIGTASTVTLDASAILTLAFLGLLEEALASFDQVVLPHTTLGWLFEEAQRLPFHQPSRVAEARRLRRLIAEDRIKPLPEGQIEPARIDQLGVSLAGLVSVAQKMRAEGARAWVIHPFPVTRPGSLSRTPVAGPAVDGLFVSNHAILEAAAATMARPDRERAGHYLALAEKPWPIETSIETTDALILDRLSLDHLRGAGMLEDVAHGFSNIYLAADVIAEADALIAYEAYAEEVETLIEGIRGTLGAALVSGRARLGTAPDEDGDLGSHPSATILTLADEVDALVSDDRFMNQYPTATGQSTEKPVWTSLDILQAMLCDERFAAARAALRRGGAVLVPLAGDELEQLLANTKCSASGVLVETAELRVLRENVRLIQARATLRLPLEAPWLAAFDNAAIHAIKSAWNGGTHDMLARARAKWLFALCDIRGWASAIEGPTLDMVARFGAAGILSRLLMGDRDDECAGYDRWLEERVALLAQDHPAEHAFLVEGFRAMAIKAGEDRLDGRISRSVPLDLAGQVVLEMLPDFMQLQVALDHDTHAALDIEINGVIRIGGVASFERQQLLRTVADFLGGAPTAGVADQVGDIWQLELVDPDQSIVRLKRADGLVSLKDYFAIDPNRDRRLGGLARAVAKAGLVPADARSWRDRLSAMPLKSDRTEYLEQDLASTPASVAATLEGLARRKEISVATLVPTDRRYYERLVGSGDTTDRGTYAREIAGPLIAARIIEGSKEFGMATLLSAHSDFARALAAALPTGLMPAIIGWATQEGDPFARVMVLEAALSLADRGADIDIGLLDLATVLLKQTKQEPATFDILSALIVVVDGELSRSGILADWPPFRRRNAAIAHATQALRLIGTGLDAEAFAKWAYGIRGHRFVLQSLIDMRVEPRWEPELVDGQQLVQEVVGRVLHAANSAKLGQGPLRAILLGKKNSFLAAAGPQYCWPGPLEGDAAPPHPLPEQISQLLDRKLAVRRATIKSVTPIINARRMATMGPQRVDRLIALLDRSNYLIKGSSPELMAGLILTSLAGIAAATRSARLADAVRIVARRARSSSPDGRALVLEMRVALTAAAAREDVAQWAGFAGAWAEELAMAATGSEAAAPLRDELEEVCAIAPELRPDIGRAIALLRLATAS